MDSNNTVEELLQKPVSQSKTDNNGKEFSSQLLESIAANAQIEQRLSLPYTPCISHDKNVESINSKRDPKYEGIFYIHGYTKNGSYILKDKTDTFLSRDVPTSQIKLINAIPNPEDNPADAEYEVQAIINHRGEAPNYEYLVRWKDFDASWDTWEIASNFDSKEPIKLYWYRQGATNNDSSNKRKRAPKSVNKRKVATREERSTKRHARLINKRRPTDTTTP
ncbi:hypothetical protein [Parasitella parasitica]|uniref:Chromo domain-containing protein n=1 Tax=Parasitella parasitica TaxID=35722 RepID=A0A0B7NLK1_9FUNG|nr:hypothetical protein [Parasitella parasitica]